jgi:hypothetical protein
MMPNGGSDNCATCGFNRNNAGVWSAAGADNLKPGYCTIRAMEIACPHWTYCRNWHTHANAPLGPVYTSMYGEGYERVPYYKRNCPETAVETNCHVCGDHSLNGIRVTSINPPLEFCGNEHYRIWWTDTMHKELARCRGMGEKAYDNMYDAVLSGASGYYSEAKDAFLEAIVIAGELELPEEQAALEARLAHIKDVFRSQF